MAKIYLSAWAKSKGTNVSKLAQEIGVLQPSLSRIETGTNWPRMETVDKLAEVLGIEVYQLFIDPASFYGKKATGVCPHCGKPIDVCLVAPE